MDLRETKKKNYCQSKDCSFLWEGKKGSHTDTNWNDKTIYLKAAEINSEAALKANVTSSFYPGRAVMYTGRRPCCVTRRFESKVDWQNRR